MSRGVKGLFVVIAGIIVAAFLLGQSSGSNSSPVATATPDVRVAINAAVAATVNARVQGPIAATPIAVQNSVAAQSIATTAIPFAHMELTPTNTPSPSATLVPATSTPTVEMFNRVVATCYGACTGGVPNHILPNQAVLVHGDLTNSGTQCNYKVYRQGEVVPNTYGRGTFQIVLIQGTPAFIDASIKGDAAGAAGAAPTSTCPQL